MHSILHLAKSELLASPVSFCATRLCNGRVMSALEILDLFRLFVLHLQQETGTAKKLELNLLFDFLPYISLISNQPST
jgi:hypothetical protein